MRENEPESETREGSCQGSAAVMSDWQRNAEERKRRIEREEENTNRENRVRRCMGSSMFIIKDRQRKNGDD